MIVELRASDLDAIMELEAASFDDSIQANREIYQTRFSLGHIMLAYRDDKLRGIISFSYGQFDPDNIGTIPDTFAEWSQQPVPKVYDTIFIYNLGVLPSERGRLVVKELVKAALERARADGCTAALAECPIPSYAGNEHVHCIQEIREALDAYCAGGVVPDEQLLFRDPHLSFYRKLYRCRVAAIKPRFLPSDRASGGYRAMLYAPL